jgi:hypothetical protein
MSNYDFQTKKDILINSHLELNSYFRDIEKWNGDEIRKRSESLAKRALEIWSYFGSRQFNENNIEKFRKGLVPKEVVFMNNKFMISTWRDVEQKLLECIYDYDKESFEQILAKYPHYVDSTNNHFITSRKISNGYCMETNLSAERIYKFCISITEFIGLSSEDWRLEY